MTKPKPDAKPRNAPREWYENWAAGDGEKRESAIRRANGEEGGSPVCKWCGAIIGEYTRFQLCRKCARQTVVNIRLRARGYAKRVLAGERLRLRVR